MSPPLFFKLFVLLQLFCPTPSSSSSTRNLVYLGLLWSYNSRNRPPTGSNPPPPPIISIFQYVLTLLEQSGMTTAFIHSHNRERLIDRQSIPIRQVPATLQQVFGEFGIQLHSNPAQPMPQAFIQILGGGGSARGAYDIFHEFSYRPSTLSIEDLVSNAHIIQIIISSTPISSGPSSHTAPPAQFLGTNLLEP